MKKKKVLILIALYASLALLSGLCFFMAQFLNGLLKKSGF